MMGDVEYVIGLRRRLQWIWWILGFAPRPEKKHELSPEYAALVARSTVFTNTLETPRDIKKETWEIDIETARFSELQEALFDCKRVLAQYPEPENYDDIARISRRIEYEMDRMTGFSS